jgi:decaprenylphospho-beta-D-ribofuranose 2-oxidase
MERKGFVQYQFVLPLESKQGLIAILNKISDAGLGSFLAVLKVFGKQDDLISFPMEGYTLALDFPVRDGLFKFLDELDEIVLQYNGRLYLVQRRPHEAGDFLALLSKGKRIRRHRKKIQPRF